MRLYSYSVIYDFRTIAKHIYKRSAIYILIIHLPHLLKQL